MIYRKVTLAIFSILLIFSFATFPAVSAYADDEVKLEDKAQEDKIRSFQKDFFMGIFHKKISNSHNPLDIGGVESEKRAKLNHEILTKKAERKYSLYERFGGDLFFVRYLGEEQTRTGLGDKLYTHIINGTENDLGLIEATEILLSKDSHHKGVYYENRPALRSESDDPRVSLYKTVTGITVAQDLELAQANYLLQTSKAITEAVTLFVSDGLIKSIAELLRGVLSDGNVKIVRGVFDALFFIAFLAILIHLGIGAVRTLRQGNASLVETLSRTGTSLISLMIAFAIFSSPVVFVDSLEKVLSGTTQLFSESLNKTFEEDEVINSSSSDNTLKAALWKQSVFIPWVQGTFGGLKYEDLYTTFSNKEKKWDLQENSAAKNIGDIRIPVSSNEEEDVRNWAALAYSCSSIYHINAIVDERKDYSKSQADYSRAFPIASKPSKNKTIYVDDFRWIDAVLKVGQYQDVHKAKKEDPYVGFRQYSFKGGEYALRSVILAILLIPLGFLGLKRTLAGVFVVGGMFSLLFRSFKNIFSPRDSDYSITANFKKAILSPFLDHFYYSMVLMLGISAYLSLGCSEDGLLQLLYLSIAIALCFRGRPRVKKVISNFRRLVSKTPSTTDIRKKTKEIKEQGVKRALFNKDPNMQEEKLMSIDEALNKYRKCWSMWKSSPAYLDKITDPKKRKYYIAFLSSLFDSPISTEVALRKIQAHRNAPIYEKSNRELDKRFAKIPTEAIIAEKANVSSFRDAEEEERRIDQIKSQYQKAKSAPESSREDLGQKKKRLKKLYRKARRLERRRKASVFEEKINKVTGLSLGKFVSMYVKLIIIAIFMLFYVLGYIFSSIFGV